ncbi:hypothetical protein [uncultured Duncaniella sp.]|uniref:hypothetical protein n=1 Tax=uncultured Duncaniella sp. TaxID=2768039 RepID=UPI0026EC1E73|nr:hypothetical protein [uncultured Duncaniella sp.]
MPGELSQTIDRITAKTKVLVERYNALQRSKGEADRVIEELRRENLQKDKLIEQLKAQVDYLSVATTVVPDRAMVEQSRQKISSMIREIDRCISDLTQ